MKILITLLISALISTAAFGSTESESKVSPTVEKIQEAPQKTDPVVDLRGTETKPFFIIPVENKQDISRKSLSEKIQVNDSNSNRWIVFLTGGLLLIAAIQAWLFIRQLNLMRNSLESAASAAKSAESSVELMRNTAQWQLRAYISVETAKIEFPEPGKPKATINYKNGGQTPAHDVQIWLHQWIGTYPLDSELPQPPTDFIMAKSVLGPGAFHTMMNEAPKPIINEPFLNLVGTPEGTIYVYGEIRYRDVFGHKHLNKYKFMYGGNEPSIPGMLKPCSDGNESD